MRHLLFSSIGRLRIVGFIEGVTLLMLIFIGIPLKYMFDSPSFTKVVGMIHGILFLVFVVQTISVGVEYGWRFKSTTWKVLLACLIPFGTFYVDRTILSKVVPAKS